MIFKKILILFVITFTCVSCNQYEEGYLDGREDGYEKGKEDGYQDGWNERQNQGFYCHECDDVRHEFR